MARFLIVGEGERVAALAAALERDGHVARSVAKVDRDSLAQVAFVLWLCEESPERFLLGAIDSSMRGFMYERGRFDAMVSETASRNSIPVAAFDGYRGDASAWLLDARAAVDLLIERPADLG